jgi:hypothetical protein
MSFKLCWTKENITFPSLSSYKDIVWMVRLGQERNRDIVEKSEKNTADC